MIRITRAIVTQLKFPQRTPLISSFRAKSDNTEDENESGIGADLTQGEQKIITKLKSGFPTATHIEVSDISGGCGAMYQISVESPDFEGLSKLKQQKMVNSVLSEEIKQMHGLQLNTKAPDPSSK